jgi:hypothetical protein
MSFHVRSVLPLAAALVVAWHASDAAASPGPQVVPQLAGTYDGVHVHWRDTVTLAADGTYARGNGDPGRWTFDGTTLVLAWKNWGPEPLVFKGPGSFAAADGHFQLTQRNRADATAIPGTYDGAHPHWKDSVTLRADGTYARGSGDPGVWIFDGKTLVLFWIHWGPEPVDLKASGHYVSPNGAFTLKMRGQTAVAAPALAPPPAPVIAAGNNSRIIRTDRRVYKRGEPVVVTYVDFPGNGTDWTNVIAAGEATNEWGDWEYTNGTPTGTRTVKDLKPGEYEARAYFSGGTDVQDRVAFTVAP